MSFDIIIIGAGISGAGRLALTGGQGWLIVPPPG
jgi:hypothetical protein